MQKLVAHFSHYRLVFPLFGILLKFSVDHSAAEVEWAHAANRLIEKVCFQCQLSYFDLCYSCLEPSLRTLILISG